MQESLLIGQYRQCGLVMRLPLVHALLPYWFWWARVLHLSEGGRIDTRGYTPLTFVEIISTFSGYAELAPYKRRGMKRATALQLFAVPWMERGWVSFVRNNRPLGLRRPRSKRHSLWFHEPRPIVFLGICLNAILNACLRQRAVCALSATNNKDRLPMLHRG